MPFLICLSLTVNVCSLFSMQPSIDKFLTVACDITRIAAISIAYEPKQLFHQKLCHKNSGGITERICRLMSRFLGRLTNKTFIIKAQLLKILFFRPVRKSTDDHLLKNDHRISFCRTSQYLFFVTTPTSM